MNIDDIDLKLDRVCTLELVYDSEIFVASRAIENAIPAFMRQEDDISYLLINFPKSFAEVQKNRLFLGRFKAVETGTHYVINERINHIEEWKVLTKIMELPSVVVNRMDINDGLFEINLRYSSHYSENLSSFISQFVENGLGRINNMGPSIGILQELNVIDKMFKLGILQVSIKLTSDQRRLFSFIGETDFGESCNNLINNDLIRALIYADDKIDNSNAEIVDIENRIYQVQLLDPILAKWRGKMNEFPVVRFRQFLRLKKDRLIILTVLPNNQIDVAYKAFFDSLDPADKNRAFLEFSSGFDIRILEEF